MTTKYSPKGNAMLSLLELIFLLQRKSYCLTTHLEHVVYLVYPMVLEARQEVEPKVKEKN